MKTRILFLVAPLLLFAALARAWQEAPKPKKQPAEVVYPLSVAAREDEVMVADRRLPGIWKIGGDKLVLHHRASKKIRTPLNAIWCVAFDKDGRLLAGDSSTRDIYRFDEKGQPQPLTGKRIGMPMSIAVDAKGDLYVSDLEIKRIWKVPAAGGEPVKFADAVARGLTVDKQGRIWAVVHQSDQLVRFTPDGKKEVVVSGRPFRFPLNVVVDDDGNAFVSDGYAKTIWKIPHGGKPEKLAHGAPFIHPVGLAAHGDSLLVADPHAKTIFKVDAKGKVTVAAK